MWTETWRKRGSEPWEHLREEHYRQREMPRALQGTWSLFGNSTEVSVPGAEWAKGKTVREQVRDLMEGQITQGGSGRPFWELWLYYREMENHCKDLKKNLNFEITSNLQKSYKYKELSYILHLDSPVVNILPHLPISF